MPAEKSSYNLRDKAASHSAPYSATTDKEKSKSHPQKGSFTPNKKGSGSPSKQTPGSPTKTSAPASPAKSHQNEALDSLKDNKTSPSKNDATKVTHQQQASPTRSSAVRPQSPTKNNFREKINTEVSKHGDAIQAKVLPHHVSPKVTHSAVVAGSPTSVTQSPLKSEGLADEEPMSRRSVSPTKGHALPSTPQTGSCSKEPATTNGQHANTGTLTKDVGPPPKSASVPAHHATGSPSHSKVETPTKQPIKRKADSPNHEDIAMPNKHAVTGSPTQRVAGNHVDKQAAVKIPVQQTTNVGKSQPAAKVSTDQLKKGLAHAGAAAPATPNSPSK